MSDKSDAPEGANERRNAEIFGEAHNWITLPNSCGEKPGTERQMCVHPGCHAQRRRSWEYSDEQGQWPAK